MFYKNKKFFLLLVTVALVLLISGVVCASSQTKLFISNQEVNTDVSPQTINGRVMVPVRVVSEYLGSTVNWDANNNAVYIQPNNKTENTTTSNTSNIKVTLTKEQKSEQLKALLVNSARTIEGDIDTSDVGDAELHYANTYANLHSDYTKFNALFSEEFINNDGITPSLNDIDRAYINALKTVDYPTKYSYDFGNQAQWQVRIQTNFKIISDVFNQYISINGKYY